MFNITQINNQSTAKKNCQGIKLNIYDRKLKFWLLFNKLQHLFFCTTL
jgi:hypothetical protein